MGHDTHRLAAGGPLRIGGVEIAHDQHLVGHSDADVLLHAITDALLGAAGLDDIGQLFPNTDDANRGRDSAEMLALAYQKLLSAGYRLVNLDCVVQAQRPKLSPHKQAMRERIARVLNVEVAQIGLKGKTGEHVGVIGREEAIMVQCVALVEAIAPPVG
ncbi:MAG TPA: 2-C-methyl-D-erythritol 2,4-cyclodiphosphate synthase [Pirellulaceae bacterium]|nr:2-C-methyl-D-erythritol 2,4-cyclodiphosphate synthase [Pirellulaceae bacterium]